jgi:hypothetical protein
MVISNADLFPRIRSRFERTVLYAIQPLYAEPINVAALSVLILYPKTSASPVGLLGFLDVAARSLERDGLLDPLRGQVGPILKAHYQ